MKFLNFLNSYQAFWKKCNWSAPGSFPRWWLLWFITIVSRQVLHLCSSWNRIVLFHNTFYWIQFFQWCAIDGCGYFFFKWEVYTGLPQDCHINISWLPWHFPDKGVFSLILKLDNVTFHVQPLSWWELSQLQYRKWSL